MKTLSVRSHDLLNKINGAHQNTSLLRAMLVSAQKKNKPVDFEELKLLADDVTVCLNETVKEFNIVKKITYRFCDKNTDYDDLIWLDGQKILVLADEKILNSHEFAFKNIDELKNVVPFFASSVIEAENIIKKEKLNLLLIDVCEDGVDCENEILKKYGKSHKIMTVSWNKSDEAVCMELGSTGHFFKPKFRLKDILVQWRKLV